MNETANIQIGDYVTTKGRSGWGQPVIYGTVVAFHSKGVVEIEIHPGITRKRSTRNVRRAEKKK